MHIHNHSMYDLIPLAEVWLEKKDFKVSVLANRVDGKKDTGIFSSEEVSIFFEDYIGLCSVKMSGDPKVCKLLTEYLQTLPKKETSEKWTIIKERETVTIPCPYCRTLVKVTKSKCPNCGAYTKG